MTPTELPPLALDYTDHGWCHVEAPPCGERLDIDSRGVHLVCDLPKGHPSKHYDVIGPDNIHAVKWCDDECAHGCEDFLSGQLRWVRQYEAMGR